MAKKKKTFDVKRLLTRRNVLLAVLACVVAFAAMYLIFDGPKVVKRYYVKSQLQKTFNAETSKLGDPLKTLGFSDINTVKASCVKPQTEDYELMANTENSNIDYEIKNYECSVSQQSYMVIGKDKAAKDQLISSAQQLEDKLVQNEWNLRDDIDMSKWFKDVTNGVDYLPDHTEVKTVSDKNTTCSLSFTVAYSQPADPAINVVYDCYVTINDNE